MFFRYVLFEVARCSEDGGWCITVVAEMESVLVAKGWSHVVAWVCVVVFGDDMLFQVGMWSCAVSRYLPRAARHWAVTRWVDSCVTHSAPWPILHVGPHGRCGSRRRWHPHSVLVTGRNATRLARLCHLRMTLCVASIVAALGVATGCYVAHIA